MAFWRHSGREERTLRSQRCDWGYWRWLPGSPVVLEMWGDRDVGVSWVAPLTQDLRRLRQCPPPPRPLRPRGHAARLCLRTHPPGHVLSAPLKGLYLQRRQLPAPGLCPRSSCGKEPCQVFCAVLSCHWSPPAPQSVPRSLWVIIATVTVCPGSDSDSSPPTSPPGVLVPVSGTSFIDPLAHATYQK